MVTIIGTKQSQTEDGKVFNKLKLQGGVEVVKSQSTGKMYLTARTTYISTTFDEAICESLIGTKMNGTVIKVEVDPYDYTVPETGEVISLDYSWEYSPLEPETSVVQAKAKELADNQEMSW